MTNDTNQTKDTIVLGAGSWGSSLAVQIAKNNRNTKVYIWGHNAKHLQQSLQQDRGKSRPPYITFPNNIFFAKNIDYSKINFILLAIPSFAFEEVVLSQIIKSQHLMRLLQNNKLHICWATKGFIQSNGKLLHSVFNKFLPKFNKFACISGPTFAIDAAQNKPTAMVVASKNKKARQAWQLLLHGLNYRVYTNDDILGVELGGAYKNIIAIACGISDGLELGSNSRAALITRGLYEITTLAKKMGAKQKTLFGLTGLGDMVLTATDIKSRNYKFGYQLARSNLNAEQFMATLDYLAEGIYAVKHVINLPKALNKMELDLPISKEIYKIIYENSMPKDAVINLMSRKMRNESHE